MQTLRCHHSTGSRAFEPGPHIIEAHDVREVQRPAREVGLSPAPGCTGNKQELWREAPKTQFLSEFVSCLITYQVFITGMQSEGSAKELGES